MPDSIYVYEIEDIIADINRRTHRRLELHPFWKYPIWTKAGDYIHFKLRDRSGGVHQIMDIAVAEKDFASVAGTKKLKDTAVSDITIQIENFFRNAKYQEGHPAGSVATNATRNR
jgi:hypothetical protein